MLGAGVEHLPPIFPAKDRSGLDHVLTLAWCRSQSRRLTQVRATRTNHGVLVVGAACLPLSCQLRVGLHSRRYGAGADRRFLSSEGCLTDVKCRPSGIPATYAEDVMASGRHWSDLSKRNRRLLIAAAVAEASLKIAVLIDIKRRPASQIRGSKWKWVAALVPGSLGIAPLSYFAFGRRRQDRSQPD
jgi:hypothetical protein